MQHRRLHHTQMHDPLRRRLPRPTMSAHHTTSALAQTGGQVVETMPMDWRICADRVVGRATLRRSGTGRGSRALRCKLDIGGTCFVLV